MKKRFIAIALISALLCGCAGQTGTNTASNMGGTISISDFESELESTGGSVTSEPEVESKPVTTTKPAETTAKPAETTTKPSASADPVDAIHYANNPPFIDENWLAQKYGNDVVTSEKGDWYLKGEDWYYADGRHMDGRLFFYGICKTDAGTWTVGKDLPEGWYALEGISAASSAFETDITSIIRSNGYSIPREVYYGGGALYLAKGDKLTGTAALMPISNGKVEDYAWYEDGVKVRSDSFYIGGKGLAPGKYRITEIPELRDSVLCSGECIVQVNNENIHDVLCNIKSSTVTVKAGDFVYTNNVKLTKIS